MGWVMGDGARSFIIVRHHRCRSAVSFDSRRPWSWTWRITLGGSCVRRPPPWILGLPGLSQFSRLLCTLKFEHGYGGPSASHGHGHCRQSLLSPLYRILTQSSLGWLADSLKFRDDRSQGSRWVHSPDACYQCRQCNRHSMQFISGQFNSSNSIPPHRDRTVQSCARVSVRPRGLWPEATGGALRTAYLSIEYRRLKSGSRTSKIERRASKPLTAQTRPDTDM